MTIEELLQDAKAGFDTRLSDIRSLATTGDEVAELAIGFHNGLAKEFGQADFARKKFDVIGKQLQNLKSHPTLRAKFQTLYAQSIVLVVSAFEAFMHNLVKAIVDECPSVITWPEKGERRNIRFDPTLLSYGSPTIGDIVVGALPQDVNFQDLQSTLRFLREYLGVEVRCDDLKDRIILYHAVRHIVVHSAGKIDPQFVRQVRNTTYYGTYKAQRGLPYIAEEKSYQEAAQVFAELADRIIAGCSPRLADAES